MISTYGAFGRRTKNSTTCTSIRSAEDSSNTPSSGCGAVTGSIPAPDPSSVLRIHNGNPLESTEAQVAALTFPRHDARRSEATTEPDNQQRNPAHRSRNQRTVRHPHVHGNALIVVLCDNPHMRLRPSRANPIKIGHPPGVKGAMVLTAPEYLAAGAAVGLVGLSGSTPVLELSGIAAETPTEGEVSELSQAVDRGRPAVEKALRSFMKRLAIHEAKLAQIQADGGYTSSVEGEITHYRVMIRLCQNWLSENP
jgi:hypothetical protein